jgi:hypothetical protein
VFQLILSLLIDPDTCPHGYPFLSVASGSDYQDIACFSTPARAEASDASVAGSWCLLQSAASSDRAANLVSSIGAGNVVYCSPPGTVTCGGCTHSVTVCIPSPLLTRVVCLCAGGGWRLLIRQTAPKVRSKDGWKSYNTRYVGDPNYSILDTLDDSMKGGDGKFLFKLKWPQHGTPNTQVWRQSSNPMSSSSVSGYEAVELASTNNGWGGVALSSSGSALLDGSPSSGNWWYAIGTTALHYSAIPGPNSATTPQVELWVYYTEQPTTEAASTTGNNTLSQHPLSDSLPGSWS